MTRYDHSGLARPTTLSANISNSVTSSIACTDLSTWSALNGAVGPFWAVINPGGSTEEKILVSSVSGNNLLTVTRGQDGTSPQAHNSGEQVVHNFTALEADAANALVQRATPGTGTLVDVATGQALTGKNLDTTSSLGGVTGATLANAWTSLTPTFGGITAIGGGGTLTGTYQQVGKKLALRAQAIFGTSPTVSGSITLTLPAGLVTANAVLTNQSAWGVAFQNSTAFRWRLAGDIPPNTSAIFFVYSDGTINLLGAGLPVTWAANDRITVEALLEVQ